MKNFDPFFNRFAKESIHPTKNREHYAAVMKVFFIPVRLDKPPHNDMREKVVEEVGHEIELFAVFSKN